MNDQSHLPTLSEQASALATKSHMTLGGRKFTVAEQVTRTVLRQQEAQPFAVTFESPAFKSAPLPSPGRPMQPPDVCNIINLETGDKQILIMNTVLLGELNRAFPNDTYVGKSFLIRGETPVNGDGEKKGYRVYQIIRIEPELPIAEMKLASEIVADGTNPVNKAGDAPKSHARK
jgi:hypothetical protein